MTIDMVTLEAARVLHGNLAFIKNIGKEYDPQFAQNGAKIGDTLRVRKPPKYTVRSGRVMQVQNATETYVNLPVTNQKGVDLNFTSAEFTLSIDEFSKRFLKPAMSRLASQVDYDALEMTLQVYNSVGAPGTTPATFQVWSDAQALLDDNLAPRDGERTAVLNPAAMSRTVDGLKGLFEAGDAIADQYRNGVMTRAIGAKWAMDQNIRNVTMGTRTGTTLVTAPSVAVAEGATTIEVDGFGAATQTVKEGEVFTVGGVYAVNDETKATLTYLKQFVATADKTASGSAMSLAFQPPMYAASGGLQNVSALPADNAAVVFYGTTASTVYPQNLIFHRDAFTFATADLKLPKNQEMASRQVVDGISLRLWEGSDITNDQFPTRSDVLYGYVPVYPELAVRVWG